jgi:hypothetical protein
VPRNDANQCWFFFNKKTIRHCERGTIEAIFCYRMPKKEIASCLAMTATEVDSFLIEKRYVIAKEEGLKQFFVYRIPIDEIGSFLIEKRYVTAKEERLKQSFVIECQKNEKASYLVMTLTNVGSFLIEQ